MTESCTTAHDDQGSIPLHELEGAVGIPFTPGNRISRLRNGIQIFPAMLQAIDDATQTIEFLTFVYWTGEIAERFASALASAAQRGVRVCVILDAIGAKDMDRRLITRMRQAGADVRWFRPPSFRIWTINNRTHRKILVCDSVVAFTGGVGIAKEWEGDARNTDEWRESHFRIEGRAVLGLRGAFLDNWIETTGSVVSLVEHSKPPQDNGSAHLQVIGARAAVEWNAIAVAFHALISRAKHRLLIASAYFVPDAESRSLLCRAAKRGVDVQILVPGPYTDERVAQLAAQSDFAELVESGIRIWRYQPTMMHAKLMVVDEDISCIGSANFNHRSMKHDDEIIIIARDRELAETLVSDYIEDVKRSKPIDLQDWTSRAAWVRCKEWLANRIRRHL